MHVPAQPPERKDSDGCDYNNPVLRGQTAAAGVMDAGLRAYMLRVYNYMLVGLLLTGATAWLTAQTPFGNLFFQETYINGHPAIGLNILGWAALLAPLGLVMFLSWRIQAMSAATAHVTFLIYAGIMGISLAPVLPALHGRERRADVLHHRGNLWRNEPVGLHHEGESVRLRLVPVHGFDRIISLRW